jgi:hypothetical protein
VVVRPRTAAELWHRFKPLWIVAAVGFVAVGVWFYWQTTKPVGRVVARIVLNGQVCKLPAHASVCNHLAYGGQVVIYGPISPTTADPTQHVVTLHSVNQTISLSLSPGSYGIGFAIERPYSLLLPNGTQGDGGDFVIRADTTINLGVVEPGDSWVITGD